MATKKSKKPETKAKQKVRTAKNKVRKYTKLLANTTHKQSHPGAWREKLEKAEGVLKKP